MYVNNIQKVLKTKHRKFWAFISLNMAKFYPCYIRNNEILSFYLPNGDHFPTKVKLIFANMHEYMLVEEWCL